MSPENSAAPEAGNLGGPGTTSDNATAYFTPVSGTTLGDSPAFNRLVGMFNLTVVTLLTIVILAALR